MTIQLSKFKNIKDVSPQYEQYADFAQLAEDLKKFQVQQEKLAAPCFSGAIYAANTTRANNNVEGMTLGILDFDKAPIGAVETTIKQQGWRAVVASSHSYKPAAPSFRVVLEPDRLILPTEWPSIFKALNVVFQGKADAACQDLSRMYLWPTKPTTSAPSYYKKIEGVPFKVDELIAQAQLITPARKKASVTAKSGSSSGDSPATAREMADYALNDIFSRDLWYDQGLFRAYLDGCWASLTDLDERLLARKLLAQFPEANGNHVELSIETLRYLAAREVQSDTTTLICVRNGVLDPITGKLQPHRKNLYLRWSLPLDWDPQATAPRFVQFLAEIWGNEPDFVERKSFLQQWLGYLLLNSCRFERFVWLVGKGANGKSVLLEIMAALIGQENVSYAMLDRLGKSAVRAELEGKLLNISSEMNVNGTLADGYLKAIVSGERIESDRKYRPSVTFHPIVKLVAATNELPRLLDRSDGFARRATILTFNRQFAPGERDITLAQTIINNELAGILAWAVNGLKILLEQGRFTLPESSEAEVKSYRQASDVVAMFVAEYLHRQDGLKTEAKILYDAFKVYAQDRGYKLCSIGEFGRRLSTHDVGRSESNGKTYRLIGLKSELQRPVMMEGNFEEAVL